MTSTKIEFDLAPYLEMIISAILVMRQISNFYHKSEQLGRQKLYYITLVKPVDRFNTLEIY